MRGRRAELWIGQHYLSSPDFIREIEQRTWSGGEGNAVCVNHQTATAIAEGGPAVGFAENILRSQLPGAHLLVAPEHVALRMGTLREKPVREANGFNRFAIIYRADLDGRLFFELTENWLRIHLVL